MTLRELEQAATDALAYAIARVPPPVADGTGIRAYAAQLAPFLIESGYLPAVTPELLAVVAAARDYAEHGNSHPRYAAVVDALAALDAKDGAS